MEHRFQIGQYVYTARDIRGWFDFSMKDCIPVNAMGVVTGQCYDELDSTDEPHYSIKFLGKNKEFGTQYIRESSLKLG